MIPAKGQNEGVADANFMRKIISDNLHSPSGSSSQQFRELTKADKIKRKLRQPRFYIPISLLFLIVIAISIAVPIVLNNNNKPRDAETTEPTVPTEVSTETEVPTTSPPTTSPTTTTLEPDDGEFRVVLRSDWLEYGGLDLSGKYKQLTPIKRVIILYVKYDDDSCTNNGHDCKKFVAEHQQEAYNDFDDITENFIVGPDGKFYEGRGFNKEGQTTYESLTSFNSKAISIGFMLKETDSRPNANQTDGFCQFIKQSIESQELDENFLLYSHSVLTSSFFTEFEETPFEEDGKRCDSKVEWGTCE